jgi:chromosome segregation ATPase
VDILLETVLQEILTEIKGLKAEIRRTNGTIQELKAVVSTLNGKLELLDTNVENATIQQQENTDIIKALLYNMEEFNAKLDGLILHTASKDSLQNLSTKEDIHQLDIKINRLSGQLSSHETEIHRLKAVR